ncbi:MAG: class I SAM-dependent methyltransferase [Myxococcales bacterium]|nr:class I SAM-dependent methyltransferase [Myxococcales bacterium]
MKDELRIWHYGLVARWWAEFNEGGDDVEYFRRAIVASGEPALDAGCGTGRLLLPFLRAGLDVDGSDASADMVELCQTKARSEGLSVNLYAQPMHALELPRRYRTIVVCGAFGLGGTRAHDLEGLRRIRKHLEPDGTLVMDHTLPNLEAGAGATWTRKPRLPQDWPEQGDRRRASDGTELELRWRVLAFDPLEQTTTREICIRQYADEREVANETRSIDICVYLKNEIELMLASAGFREIRVTGGLEDRPPRPWDDARIVFEASA